jgi:adenylate kinase family enzyme
VKRISVVGSSGSGKTTLARRLAAKLGVPHIELDGLHWDPNWTPVDDETFRARVDRATAGDAWVADGNYSRARTIVLARADTVVWLDIPLRTCLARVLRRTARRSRTKEELWSGNRESWWRHFGRDSLVWWVITSHRRKRREYTTRFFGPDPEYPHLDVHRFRSSAEAEAWLASV